MPKLEQRLLDPFLFSLFPIATIIKLQTFLGKLQLDIPSNRVSDLSHPDLSPVTDESHSLVGNQYLPVIAR